MQRSRGPTGWSCRGHKKEGPRFGAPRARGWCVQRGHYRVRCQRFKGICTGSGWLQMRGEAADGPCQKPPCQSSPSTLGEAPGDGTREAALPHFYTLVRPRAKVRLKTPAAAAGDNRRARKGKVRMHPKHTLSKAPPPGGESQLSEGRGEACGALSCRKWQGSLFSRFTHGEN